MTFASEIPLSLGDKSPLALKPLLAAKPQDIYRHRAERLETLAEGRRWQTISSCAGR
nr:hypothetical protein [Shewanella dokdonensis]